MNPAVLWLAAPLSYFLGGGASFVTVNGANGGNDLVGTIEVGAGYHVKPEVAIGLHVRGSHTSGDGGHSDDGYVRSLFSLRTADIGVSCQLTFGRALFQPWVGLHVARGERLPMTIDRLETLHPSPMPTGGFLFAFDMWRDKPDALALFLEMQTSSGSKIRLFTGEYSSFTVGVAWRR